MTDVKPVLPSMSLLGMRLASVSGEGLLDHMFGELAAGRGGWVVTANLDFLRRFVRDPAARRLYESADVRVADGMPLVWASKLQGESLPERVAGSTIIWCIAERAAEQGRAVYLLGGTQTAREKAAETLVERSPRLRIAGLSGPRISDPPTSDEIDAICQDLRRAEPDIILCAFGTPKQEYVLREARIKMPKAWMLGVGISLGFVAGEVQRAPVWMQAAGVEWLHRLAQEPRRLARRYLLDDCPFAVELFARALWQRASSGF